MTHIHVGSTVDATLQEAILLYRESHGTKAVYASIHKVTHRKGRAPEIEVGKPLTLASLQQALHQVAEANGATAFSWVDQSVIATGPGLCVWWTPAMKRWMHFDGQSLRMHLPAKQPPLLWVTLYNRLYVFALGANRRPTPEDPVFYAPYMNVWVSGEVCQGNMPRPANPCPAAWEEAFYSANFTHVNDPGVRKLTSFRGGIAALWRNLMSSKAQKAFPLKTLVAMHTTVGAVVAAIETQERK